MICLYFYSGDSKLYNLTYNKKKKKKKEKKEYKEKKLQEEYEKEEDDDEEEVDQKEIEEVYFIWLFNDISISKRLKYNYSIISFMTQ